MDMDNSAAIKVGDKVDIAATVEVVGVHKNGNLIVKGMYGDSTGESERTNYVNSAVVTKIHERPLKVGDKVRHSSIGWHVYTLIFEGKYHWFVTWGEDGEGTISKDQIRDRYERV